MFSSIVALLLASNLQAQQPILDSTGWREDLHTLSTALLTRHRNAFARMKREDFDAAVARLDARIPRLKPHEVMVEFSRLVAMLNDGHTALAPDGEPRMGFGRFPIEMYDFADGLYIVAADSAHKDLLGARVTKIGSATVAAAMDSASHLVSHEGPQWVRLRAPSLLTIPQVVAALGFSADPLQSAITIEQDGRSRTVTLASSRPATNVLRLGAPLPSGWRDVRQGTAADDPLWLQNPDRPMWFTVLPDRTLYIVSREVTPFANGETNEAFYRRAFAAGDSARVERVVLDLRSNGGGNNFMNRFVVKEVVRRPAIDRPNHFLVLIGRNTFSAAQSLVNELDYYTAAMFVGEPTGNAPNQYGDARAFELPRSHLAPRISSLLWESHAAGDDRTAFPPSVFAQLTFADYRDRKDPVLATALRRATGPGFVSVLTADAERGDSGAVRRLVESYRANPENQYRDIEGDVNRAGYDALSAGKTAMAVIMFAVNAGMFPRSGNVYDSLGEALEKAGRRDEAIAAYRKALALNANLFSSRDGLQRLGGTP